MSHTTTNPNHTTKNNTDIKTSLLKVLRSLSLTLSFITKQLIIVLITLSFTQVFNDGDASQTANSTR